MKTKHSLIFSEISPAKSLGRLFALFGASILSVSTPVRADIPDQLSSGRFGGIYKVTTSTDPIFPATETREYFLDFGRGIQAGKMSGDVAVSMRENPNVKVRIMAWQYFPDQEKILIGNPFAEGSNRVVAKGVWQMKTISGGVLFKRGSYHVVLRTADPGDY